MTRRTARPTYGHLRSPGDTASSTLAGDHRSFIGVYQVSIVAPANTGKIKTNPLVAELTALFPL